MFFLNCLEKIFLKKMKSIHLPNKKQLVFEWSTIVMWQRIIERLLVIIMGMFNWAMSTCCSEKIVIENRTYRIEKLLAEGGFSYVYIVRGPKNERFAAKRVIAQNQDQIRATKWEINVHRMLGDKNPNIMPLLGADSRVVNQNRVEFSLIFPLYPKSLIDVLLEKARTNTEVSETKIVNWMIQICNAVLQLHNLDPPLAHRDIKPHNVLLTGDEVPVLMDFGSAANANVDVSNRQARTQLYEQAAQHSSMAYRAPELWDSMSNENAVVDTRTDSWSLGCLLFAMLFGQGFSPFECTFSSNSYGMAGGAGQLSISRAVLKDCSYLAVIAKVKFPEHHSRSSQMLDIVTWILNTDPAQRPFVSAIIDRLESAKSQFVGNV